MMPFRTLLIAVRPFSLPASAVPVVFGTVLAWSFANNPIHWWSFIAALIGMTLLQGAANVINDVYDFERGLDTSVLPVSGAVVRGLMSPKEAIRYSVFLFVMGCLIGLSLALTISIAILWIGLFGVTAGVLYSATPFGLKYRGLGDLSVFFNFGMLGSLGAWVVQTGEPSWLPVIWSLPISLLVVAILHANNWRDIAGDSGKGFKTIASLLGDSGSELYYSFLLSAPYVFIAFLIALSLLDLLSQPMPAWFLLTFLSIPLARKLVRRAKLRKAPVHPIDFVALDGATAQLNLLFGALSIIALIAHEVMPL